MIRGMRNIKLNVRAFYCLLVLLLLTQQGCHIERSYRQDGLRLAADGSLEYTVDFRGNRIPDFSHVGYRNGEEPIPDVPVVITLSPVDSKTDDTKRIQEALDLVGSMPLNADGLRGAVFLEPGTYWIYGSLKLLNSGVVLRGSGTGEDGSRMVAVGYGQPEFKRTLIEVGDTRKPVPIESSRSEITTAYVPVGAHSFEVVSSEGFSIGDRVLVFRPSTQRWIRSIGMDQIPIKYEDLVASRWLKDGKAAGFYYRLDGELAERRFAKLNTETWEQFQMRVPVSAEGRQFNPIRQWRAGEYDFFFERTIIDIHENQITIDAPIVQAIDRNYGVGAIYLYDAPGRIENVGVEQLQLVSEFGPPSVNLPFGPETELKRSELHGWNAIRLNRNTEHTWVRSVDSLYFGWATVYASGTHATIRNCRSLEQASIIRGGRRYPFAVDGQRNLFQDCASWNGRHEFVCQKKAAGPNVFVNCVGRRSKDRVGPHHRYAVGTLFDNVVSDKPMESRNRGNSGSGHGWAGAQTVFYNCVAPRFYVEQAPDTVSWVIGCSQDGSGRVEPKSLYLWQLNHRLSSK